MSTMKRLSTISGLLLLGACLALPALGQATGGIKGKITGDDGKPLQKAVITITRTDKPGASPITTKTDKHGEFDQNALAIGTYDVAVTPPKGGQALVIQQGVVTKAGQSANLEADLKTLEAQAALASGKAPPGMSKEEAAAYEKKLKEQEEQNKKLGTLNGLLQQNKQFLEAKQYDQAIAVMEKAVSLDTTHDILFANLAEDYSDAKQYDKAADAYRKAMALKPTNAGYVINLGTVLSKAGKVDEANTEFAKAAAMDPSQAKMAMYNSAVVLLNQGNLDGAGAAFDKLLALDPTNGDAWYYKGICLLGKATTDAKGNVIAPPGAVEALQNSIKYAPNGPNAATAKAELQTLKAGGGGL